MLKASEILLETIKKDGRPERILYGDDINEDYMMQCITSSSEVPNIKEAD